MDFARLRTGEIVAAAGGALLFAFMFFDWFGGGLEVATTTREVEEIGSVETPSGVREVGVSAWDALQDFSGFLIALAAVSGVALGALAAAGRRVNLGGLQRGQVTAGLGSLAVALILWRLLANTGDLKIGIFLGLAAAVAIVVGAVLALREDGFEPLVAVPGRRTRASGSGAPSKRTGRSTATKARSSSARKSSSGSRGTASKRGSSSRSASGKATGKRSSSSRSSSRTKK